MAFQCRIWNMNEEYSLDIVRFYNGRIEKITSGNLYRDSSLKNRIYLSKRVFPDRTHVYVLTMLDISENDSGKYLCRVVHESMEENRIIAADTVNVELYSFPTNSPNCEIVPRQPTTINVGDRVILKCISETGAPVVELRWSSTYPSIRLVSRNTSTSTSVASEVTITSDTSYHGAVFTCHLSNPGFPNRERTCHIGPITIHNIEREDADITQPVIQKADRDETIQQDMPGSVRCNMECSLEDEDIVLYLTISTIGAGILCFLFLSTTIIFCYKYHSISTEAIEAIRNVPCNDGSEPVYVSLQRRQEYDRNSICSSYMTVEDPNNPGSKVVMPKEVFEEFYRTLTIKRV